MNRGFAKSILILGVSLSIINPVLPTGAQNQNSLGYNPNQILQQLLGLFKAVIQIYFNKLEICSDKTVLVDS